MMAKKFRVGGAELNGAHQVVASANGVNLLFIRQKYNCIRGVRL